MATNKKNKALKTLALGAVTVFKIANRRGYAALALRHLTEGRSVPEAYARLVKACRRSGYALPEDRLPKAR